ncbi:MAG: winged helix-turn-helix domain-containing protein [bacterium]|nr:winged helix-turn-helix domain-containing protein [bacterium]
MDKSIEALFGSKTRVKLLNLFLSNPSKRFYVREITRLINEQVNSVRRELKNLEEYGILNSSTEDRKLFYGINQRFKFYIPLRAIFAGSTISEIAQDNFEEVKNSWKDRLKKVRRYIDIVVISGVLVDESKSDIDMLIVGDNSNRQLSEWANLIEKQEGRELNYVVLPMEDFYYRYTTRDTFINNIFKNKYQIVVDKEGILDK